MNANAVQDSLVPIAKKSMPVRLAHVQIMAFVLTYLKGTTEIHINVYVLMVSGGYAVFVTHSNFIDDVAIFFQ